MRIAFLLLVFVHAIIHLLGFVKSVSPLSVSQLTKEISRPAGIAWLFAFLLLVVSAIFYLLHKQEWWIPAIVAILLSQLLIFTNWSDAKWGTFANLLILAAAITGWGQWRFQNQYRGDIRKQAAHLSNKAAIPLLTGADIQYLPEPVQKYIRYTGCINQPKLRSFKILFKGRLRGSEKESWMPLNSEQYNFIESPARLFFLTALMKHLPVAGYHHYKNGKAVMDIRLLSLFKVQYQDGAIMDRAETVTFFNDMCCMAPGSLIDERIKWHTADSNTVDARFTNGAVTITATLYFNDTGELVNFISNDRPALQADGTLKKVPWSTPLKNYKEINGHTLAHTAATVYKYPEGPFIYGEFELTGVEYNPY